MSESFAGTSVDPAVGPAAAWGGMELTGSRDALILDSGTTNDLALSRPDPY